MATPLNDDVLSVLMVGKSGEGKSSTGNSILGRKVFQAKHSATPVTTECQRKVASVQGHNVVVVDSPGLADTDIKTNVGKERLANEIKNILTIQPDGFDAVLIVVCFGRVLTEEDKWVIQQLEAFYGTDYVKQYGILVVAHADMYNPEECGNVSIETFLKSQKDVFETILEKCNNRLAYFDNRTKDESVRQAQVKRLLKMVAGLRQSSDRYIPEIFLEAQKSRDEAVSKTKKSPLKQSTELSLTIILQELQDILKNSTEAQTLGDTKSKLQELLEQLKNQDEDKGPLTDTTSSVSQHEEAVMIGLKRLAENDDPINCSEKLEKVNALNDVLEKWYENRRLAIGKEFAKAFQGFFDKAVEQLNLKTKSSWVPAPLKSLKHFLTK